MAFLPLTFNLPGPVDRSVLTKSLERLLQRGRINLTGRQHSQELCVPLGLITKQLEVSLQKTNAQLFNKYIKKKKTMLLSIADTRRWFF